MKEGLWVAHVKYSATKHSAARRTLDLERVNNGVGQVCSLVGWQPCSQHTLLRCELMLYVKRFPAFISAHALCVYAPFQDSGVWASDQIPL